MSVTDRHWSDAEQLPMFLDPADIVERVESGEWHSADDIHDYSDKLYEALENGLADSISRHGVKMPVTLTPPGTHTYWADDERVNTGNGHHRTAVAAHLGIGLVAVVWDEGEIFADYSLHGLDAFGDAEHAWTGEHFDGGWYEDDEPDDDEDGPLDW